MSTSTRRLRSREDVQPRGLPSFRTLLLAEIQRFASRRLIRSIAMGVVASIVASALIAFIQSSNDPDAGLADARREVASCEEFKLEHPDDGILCPTVEELAANYDKRFVYVDTMPDSTRGVAVALFVLSFVVAASFVGADWGSGFLTTLLTWEPRRGRVLAAKTITAVALLATATAVLLAFLDVVYLPVASIRGTTEGLSGSEWWTLAGIWARGAALSTFAAAVASGIATIARNTAAPIGVAFAYGVVIDPILGFIRSGRFRPWLLQHNIAQLLGFPVFDVPEETRGGTISLIPDTRTITRPVVLFVCYAAAVLAVAYLAFRERDVT